MRLIAAARHYLAGKQALPACRFDAVLLESEAAPVWIKDAFAALPSPRKWRPSNPSS
jgi:Holliday junction resolvase-like predicted endonuclease